MRRLSGVLVLMSILLVPTGGLLAQANPDSSVLVAVLELENQSKRVDTSAVQFITDMVRQAASEALDQAKYRVLTRDTMEVLLPASEMKCLAGQCLAKIGQRLQAKYVVGGSLKDVGSRIGITLETYESSSGMLRGSESRVAKDVDDAVTQVQQMAPRLMRRVIGERAVPAAGAGGTVGGAGEDATVGGATPAGTRQVGEVAAEIGKLLVEGKPRGAPLEVVGPRDFADKGRLVGTIPYGPADAPPGRYRIKVTTKGYEDFDKSVTVYADRTEVVRVELELSTGTLDVTGDPRGAKVELDCSKGFHETFGIPGTLVVPRGACTVKVSRNGYETFERTVQVVGGKTERLAVKLVQVREDRSDVAAGGPAPASGSIADEIRRIRETQKKEDAAAPVSELSESDYNEIKTFAASQEIDRTVRVEALRRFQTKVVGDSEQHHRLDLWARELSLGGEPSTSLGPTTYSFLSIFDICPLDSWGFGFLHGCSQGNLMGLVPAVFTYAGDTFMGLRMSFVSYDRLGFKGFGWTGIEIGGDYYGVSPFSGIHWGIGEHKGFFGAFANVAVGSMYGVQIGGITYGGNVNGVQIAFINLAARMKGVQVGFVNIAWENAWPFMVGFLPGW